jgi:hypothetical protein
MLKRAEIIELLGLYIYIYIYIERERERERELYLLFSTSSALRANTHDTLSSESSPTPQLEMSTQV